MPRAALCDLGPIMGRGLRDQDLKAGSAPSNTSQRGGGYSIAPGGYSTAPGVRMGPPKFMLLSPRP